MEPSSRAFVADDPGPPVLLSPREIVARAPAASRPLHKDPARHELDITELRDLIRIEEIDPVAQSVTCGPSTPGDKRTGNGWVSRQLSLSI